MERVLPVLTIEGIKFTADAIQLELREKENPENIISFENMRDVGNGYSFEYSRREKNLPSLFNMESVTVTIPEWVLLDPVGMAQKYGLTPETLKGKTDFELMVDQEALDYRINKGMLPTVDIAGQLFYVDLRMDMLRPKDDFLSKGIVLSEIGSYHLGESDEYLIPYNPKTHEFQEIDLGKITEYPKDLIAAKFPSEWKLDPIGWNRLTRVDWHDGLKHTGLRSHCNAEIIPWEKTVLRDVIRENRERENKQTENKNIQPSDHDIEQGRRKGRKR
ncbi:hypothetical protein ACTJJ0_12355 [Chitinophaga sp. 22321]|uniref:Uncharacterized protein n=1 Tax=Chitinophaga hostae TaxID=2831022 RepID=A0ABS5IWK8_9BACT|nr:hypothetical protein [Chitinophaga hostae]MBS0027250.1 hypothetical protein [Chitinophaga hostae]